jgi:putative membrane protein
MVRSILFSVVLVAVCVGCKGKTDVQAKEGTLSKVDTAKGTAAVKMKKDGKEVESNFKLAERIEYMDSAGDVATADIFTSGDNVLIFETDGTITKMKNKDKTVAAKAPDTKDKNDKNSKSADAAFIRAADQINLAEMKLGKVAEENAKNDLVKKFGTQSMSDHAHMNMELRKITAKQGITLNEKLDSKHQEMLDELAKLKEVSFDKAYTKDMISGHEKAIELFENEAKTGRDPEVKMWAEKCLPILREHLKLAQAAVNDVKGK